MYSEIDNTFGYWINNCMPGNGFKGMKFGKFHYLCNYFQCNYCGKPLYPVLISKNQYKKLLISK